MKTTGLAILFAACALLLAQPALAATTHYASPGGSGTACSVALPCSLAGAVTGLVAADTVVVGPGTYDLGSSGLNLPTGISLVGADGPRPTITGASAIGATVSVIGATVKHLAISQTGGQLALSSAGPSVLEDLALTSNGNGASISGGDVLRDSVVRLTGSTGTGIQSSSFGTSHVRNVLVSAPGANTMGIVSAGLCIPMPDPTNPTMFTCMPMPAPTIDVRNSILRAGTSDLVTSGGTATGLINVAYSDYRAAKTSAPQAGSLVDGGGNIEGDPLFADAAGGDFHQLAGSPVIDAGDPLAAGDSWVGALDLDGVARILGGRIDMGPFEFQPASQPTTGDGSKPGDGTPQGGGDQQPGDGSANPPVAPATGSQADTTAPVLRSLRIAPGVLRKSSLVSYVLSERAATTLTVLRKTTGVKKGRTCAKAPRKVKKGAKRCTRWVVVSGSVSRAADVAGKNSFSFNGKLRGKRLAVGSYRLVAFARDIAGNVGKPVMVSFRVRAR